MKNKNYYPFERNHYFYGKLLTVRDFELEQKYFNNKRRIQNRLLHGAGVVAGLDVVMVDEQSISLEMGMALDYHGREILVQEPAIKKLHMLEGFEEVKHSNNIYLCIEYDEELAEPVHTVASTPAETSESSQFNRISESYRLFLTDEPLPSEALTFYKLYQEKKILFQNDKLTVEQVVPRYVRQGQKLDSTILITKKGSMEPVELQYEIESEHLSNEQGQRVTAVSFQEKTSKTEFKVQERHSFYAKNVKQTTDQLIIKQDRFSMKLGEEEFALEEDIQFQVQIIDQPVNERILEDYYRQDFSELLFVSQQARIFLARINLITSDDLYIIDSLEKMPYQQYVVNSELFRVMLEAGGGNGTKVWEQGSTGDMEEEIRKVMAEYLAHDEEQESDWATGVEEMDLGFENTKNKRFFSNEIAHGLGTGPVALLFALEDVENILEDKEQNVLVFGQNSVFDQTLHETGLPDYQVGALAYPNKGTFRLGLRLFDNLETTTIKIRWWAYKHPGEELKEASLLELSKVKVVVSPDTVNLAPREKTHFTAHVEGTNYKECRWYVKDEKGGQVDHNGVYEAPNHEGVFEIVAESVKYPEKKGSAFVVVKG